jgi:hypothetical protein
MIVARVLEEDAMFVAVPNGVQRNEAIGAMNV